MTGDLAVQPSAHVAPERPCTNLKSARDRDPSRGALSPEAGMRGPRIRLRGPVAAWPAWAVAAVCFAIYLTISLARWHRMDNPSWDLAIFEQAIKGYAHFGAPIVDIKGAGFNQLGDHFSPLLVLLAPFYRLFPSPLTLLVAQCLLVAISIVPLCQVARRNIGPWPGLAIGVAYGLSWGIQSGIDVQFHEYCLAMPLLAFGLAAFLEKKWVASVIWIALLIGVKEDLGLTVAAFGVCLMIRHRIKLGAGVFVGALAAWAAIMLWIVPAFNPSGQWDYWSRLSDGGEATGTTVSSVWGMVTGLFTPEVKLGTIALLVLLGAGICLRSPLMIMVVPTLAWRFLAPDPGYWATTWHYSLVLMPIVVAAAIDGIMHLEPSRRAVWRGWAKAAPWAMLLLPVVLVGNYPFKDLFDAATYAPPARQAAAQQVLSMIPDGTSVATDRSLITRLVTNHTVYWIRYDDTAVPDYLLFDEQGGWGDNPPADAAALAETAYPGTEYVDVFDQDGFHLAKRVR